MRVPSLRLAALALSGGLLLGGCAYGFGDPYGSYGSLGVGYGNYGYGGYGYGGYPYGGYGYGYGSPYGGYGDYLGYGYGGYPYGWYNGFYYPGSGYYVYDRNHHRRQITDAERQYWRDKFARYRSSSTSGSTVTTSSVTPRENWSGFKRVRTRSVDTTSSSNDNSNRGSWRRGGSSSSQQSTSQSSQSSSSSSSNRSSDFMQRHSPHRQKD